MDLPSIIVYATQSSARLSFVLDWLFKERLGLSYELRQEKTQGIYRISAGTGGNSITIYDAGLLWEQGIKAAVIDTGEWNELFTFYPQEDHSATIPFDLFSAVFYLLSRYEEYLDFEPDKHGRYPHSESILRDVLARPVVDEWVEMLRQLLADQWNMVVPKSTFKFLPTYDIDIAWSYKHKGWKRWLGAAFKDITCGNFSNFVTRCRVAMRNLKDPYDSFAWMKRLHDQHQLKPNYFILSSLSRTDFDKNISPNVAAMKALVRRLSNQGQIGIHPSYFTKENPDKLTDEQAALQAITGNAITGSRQHYIRLFFPDTYRMLLAAGINDDYSMGYSTSLGFRAGTSHTFSWYDLQNEQQTPLLLHPFCFMDTSAHYDLQLSVSEAFNHLKHLQQRLEDHGGTLTTIFHNFSLGSDKEWDGWSGEYAKFLAGIR